MRNNISYAAEDDLNNIMEIWTLGLKNNYPNEQFSDQLYGNFKENFQNRAFPYNFWVAKKEHKILGWVSVLPIFMQPLKRQTDAEISIYVAPSYMDKGLGTELTLHVFNEIALSEIQNIWAFVLHSNLNSKIMCENAGMKVCGKTSTKLILIKEFLK